MSYVCQYIPSHIIFISIHSTTLDIPMIVCIKIYYNVLLSSKSKTNWQSKTTKND